MTTQEIIEKENKETKWVKLSSKQIESLIVDLAKQGQHNSQIGIELRDKHGVPKAKSLINKRISKVLKASGIKTKTESDFIAEKIERIKKHKEKNKQDHTASKALTKKLWALKKRSE